jgi:outer membrane receptor protein involved in Fe transport
VSKRKTIECLAVLLMFACFCPASMPLFAQSTLSDSGTAGQQAADEQDVVSYPASYFDRYRPNSALDMLEQLPGFRLASSGELRGYGSDVGNVLIDGRRPGSKRVTVPSILDRIPASQVERIELIRGPTRDIELLGEPEVANVVLRTDVPAAVRWIFTGYRNSDMGPMPWFSNVSMSDRLANLDYNAGLDVFRVAYSDTNNEDILDGGGNLTEQRFERGHQKEFEGNFDFSTSTWMGETLLTWNSQLGIQEGSEVFFSRRTPLTPGEGVRHEHFDGVSDEFQYEVGITAERRISRDLTGNLLVFFSREDESSINTQRSVDSSGMQTAEKFKDSDQIEEEAIVRTEFEWTGIDAHTIRLNLEGTYNLVANTEVETEDTGTGPVTVFVPGANTTLEEYRWDILLKDVWSFGVLELDYGLGAEVSKLTQAGDADVERKLSYLRPQAELSYTPDNTQRIRLRLAREVAQLMFDDFISASLFADEDLALGNPDLKPETTWVSELGYEQRFGRENVLKFTLFHHWISDVQDLIPITLTEEAPGNIGDGRRWGIEFEGTIQLDRVGLRNARMDINARWQDSTVVDPITGEDRVLTSTILADNSSRSIFENDNEYVVVAEFRQDFDVARIAWGWDVTFEADLRAFKVNELELRNKGADLGFFIETTRWIGLKLRLEFNNVFDKTVARQRDIFVAERGLSPLLRSQLQDRTDGREIGLSLSGSF